MQAMRLPRSNNDSKRDVLNFSDFWAVKAPSSLIAFGFVPGVHPRYALARFPAVKDNLRSNVENVLV